MSVLTLITKEISHRKVNFFLGALAVVTAIALFVGFFTAGKAANRETARLMLSMGYNLTIAPKHTDINQFLLTGIPDKTMPEQYLDKLASQTAISYNHLLATLQKKISWRGLEVILTGLAPEVCPPNKEKPPMSFMIKRGDIYLGYRVAQYLGLRQGEEVEIGGKTLTIVKCLTESGSTDDIRIQCHLHDAQEILNLPGQLSEIRAVDCLCVADTDDPLSVLRAQINSILPEAQVLHAKSIALVRAKQRQLIRNVFAIMIPFVIVICGVWIGILAVLNVRDRQQEIGLLRALGYGSGKITALFLGKAVVVGMVGAIVGFLLGTVLALEFGPGVFKITAEKMIRFEPALLAVSLIFAPVFAAVSSFIPTMVAVTYDPAVTLMEQ